MATAAVQAAGVTMTPGQVMAGRTGRLSDFIVIDNAHRYPTLGRLIMALFAVVGGLNVAAAFAAGGGAVMATDTVIKNIAMVHCGIEPGRGIVAGIAFQGCRNMSARQGMTTGTRT